MQTVCSLSGSRCKNAILAEVMSWHRLTPPPGSQGNFKGLDADYCRALAAGVLGDPAKVRLVALTAQNRCTALQSGEIDVLYRDSTATFLR